MSRAIEYDLSETLAEFNSQPKRNAKRRPAYDHREAEVIGLAATLPNLNQQLSEVESRRPHWDGESVRSPEFLRWCEQKAAADALYDFALNRIFESDCHTPRVTAVRMALFDQTYKALDRVGAVGTGAPPTSLTGMAMRIVKGMGQGEVTAFV